MQTNPIFIHYKEEATNIVTLFRLDLRDGTQMGFTNFDEDIVIGSYRFKAYGGMTPTALSTTSQNNVDNLDVDGYLDDESITESDMQAGRYDNAKVIIYEMNWNDKPYSFSKCRIKKKGQLGEVQLNKSRFVAEIRGLTQNIQNNINELFQPTCRAKFGDSKCKIDKTLHQDLATVTSRAGPATINVSGITPGYFDNGLLRFITGLNVNLEYEIKTNTGSSIEVQLPFSYEISPGDQIVIYRGCNYTKEDCFQKYNNMINFRGEPFIPQTENLINRG